MEQWHSLMFQMFPKAGSSGWDQTLEALPILCFQSNGVFLKGRNRPAAGVQHLQEGGAEEVCGVEGGGQRSAALTNSVKKNKYKYSYNPYLEFLVP